MSAAAGNADDSRTIESHPRPASTKRKHRPGLQRVSIACERCRSRKNKCDRKLPECSTCKAAGVICVIQDRLTNRQYPRGHVDGLENEVQRLNARVQELELEVKTLKEELLRLPRAPPEGFSIPQGTPDSHGGTNVTHQSASPFENLAEELNVVPRHVTAGQRYIGDSSGLFFGNIVQAFLLQADYKGEHGPSRSSLRMRVAGRQITSSTSPVAISPVANSFRFPDHDLARRLEDAYFTHQWPSLPFIHRPTFLEHHFTPTMTSHQQVSHVSLFLTTMVLAIGSLDFKRQNPEYGNKHIELFRFATENYLHGLLKEDSIETVQGLLLVTQFAIHEQESTNAWLVSGQAVRAAVDLGLHREVPSAGASLMSVEMRSRVFWSAYALDRNISITLGRPCAIREEDIDLALPQNLRDKDLVGVYSQVEVCTRSMFVPLDMSTFIHIIKLRQLQSRIQGLFYAADTTQVRTEGVQLHRMMLRAQLDEWISQSPRYANPTKTTFQSTDWFQIAYSHALLLLFRPSPASPIVDSEALQLCADSAISLISSYSSLYAKNKITYTWIALHSLFMASITMLYTLHASLEIRASTTKAVVKSNVASCLALFEVMTEYWPLAAHCHEIIEHLGSITIDLFASKTSETNSSTLSLVQEQATQQHFGQIDAEFMEWFGTRENDLLLSAEQRTQPASVTNADAPSMSQDEVRALNDTYDLFSGNLDLYFLSEFDSSIPMMMNVFGNGPHGLS
ncbi:hypothetical protein BS50DRAFT_566967 [Corynespora cassiicola Philippines]|uniref:Zn(2)-C6 fungal-type domain-containing protein n=1 Tax=Corynespora cassiicola Philippines TaxID=1448308 RepID=A0A2T2P8T9_CORCC|nr:hypothetical protein BS50DRAFT_566967 [Corynespora cassiicola Philippines]